MYESAHQHISTSAHQHISTSAHQHISTSVISIMTLFNKHIVLIFAMLMSQLVFSQQPIPGIEITPSSFLDNVFDRFGNQYNLADLQIVTEQQATSFRSIASTQPCQAGIFNLVFESGSGMESPTIAAHNQRRAVICQVFQDVSNFINTPLKNAGNSTKVNIWVRNIQLVNPNPNVGGVASGYFNVPANGGQVIIGGIIDNEIYKTIHAGVDSYTNVRQPIFSTIGGIYHGMVAFNFNAVSLNTDLNQLAVSPQNDLYTVALHEVLHALGFASQFNANGTSNFINGYNYYSRYDTFLRNFTNNPLIITASATPMYDYNFVAAQQNNLHPGCSLPNNINPDTVNITNCSNNNRVFFNSPSVLNMPVYTPSCFEIGSSLSHFEDQCYINTNTGLPHGNDNYFVMSNSNTAGTNKRFPTSEERNALCDLGYSLNTVYSQHTYANATVCAGNGVAGINDGFVTLSNITNYAFVGTADTVISITNLLGNDLNYEDGINLPANLRFEGLQDVYDSTSTISVSGNDNNATITFRSINPGQNLLRYVPFNTNGSYGNITYVYVYLTNQACTPQDIADCENLVLNGDFEQNFAHPNTTSQIHFACGWRNEHDNIMFNNRIGTCDYFAINAAHPAINIPQNALGNQNTNNNIGSHYAGFYGIKSYDVNNLKKYHEVPSTTLKTNLLPNQKYQLKFDVSLADRNEFNRNPFQIQALISASAPSAINDCFSDFNITASDILLKNKNNFGVPIISGNSAGWETLVFNFTTESATDLKYLYIGPIKNVLYNNMNLQYNTSNTAGTGAYYYLDNVSLVPLDATLALPATICSTNNLTDLSIYLQNANPTGTFEGPGVTHNNGIFSFNAALAGAGTHNINYTFVATIGCAPIIITTTIKVLGNYGGLPFISQIYADEALGREKDRFIEIKNKSQNDIAAGTYYLAVYNYPNSTSNAPDSFIDIGAMSGLETKVFCR